MQHDYFDDPYRRRRDWSSLIAFLLVIGLFLAFIFGVPLAARSFFATAEPADQDASASAVGVQPTRPALTPSPALPAVAAVLATPTAAPPTATVVPTATPVPPTQPPAAAVTPTPAAPGHFLVGNTGGDGVYIRRTPNMADRLVAWPDNTRLEDLNEQVTGDGQTWQKVRDPRGNVGYVPVQWLVRP